MLASTTLLSTISLWTYLSMTTTLMRHQRLISTPCLNGGTCTFNPSKYKVMCLIRPIQSSKIFPTTVRNGGEGNSHDALQSSMERIMEARQRRIRG